MPRVRARPTGAARLPGMARFKVDIELEVDVNIEALPAFAHERLQAIAAADPNVRTELGRDATPQQIADWCAPNPSTVVSAVVRALLEHGLQPLEHVVAIGPNTISSKPL